MTSDLAPRASLAGARLTTDIFEQGPRQGRLN